MLNYCQQKQVGFILVSKHVISHMAVSFEVEEKMFSGPLNLDINGHACAIGPGTPVQHDSFCVLSKNNINNIHPLDPLIEI
jgi:hypothetical protein